MKFDSSLHTTWASKVYPIYSLNNDQREWLTGIRGDMVLNIISGKLVWYDFRRGSNIIGLKYGGNYWPETNIIELINYVLRTGEYNNNQRECLLSLRQYVINRKEIEKQFLSKNS